MRKNINPAPFDSMINTVLTNTTDAPRSDYYYVHTDIMVVSISELTKKVARKFSSFHYFNDTDWKGRCPAWGQDGIKAWRMCNCGLKERLEWLINETTY